MVIVRILITILFSVISVISFAETLSMDDLVERNEFHYKKFTNVPVTANIEDYWPNGQLKVLGNFKNGKKVNKWEEFYRNGKLKLIRFNYFKRKAQKQNLKLASLFLLRPDLRRVELLAQQARCSQESQHRCQDSNRYPNGEANVLAKMGVLDQIDDPMNDPIKDDE